MIDCLDHDVIIGYGTNTVFWEFFGRHFITELARCSIRPKNEVPKHCTSVTNLGVIWLDPHNFLVRSHGQLLSMTSLVRVLPASAYTSNMVPNI